MSDSHLVEPAPFDKYISTKTFVSQTIGKAGLLPVNLPLYEPMVPQSKVQEAKNLLAVILRDGGHHTDAVGFEQSCKDAREIVVSLLQVQEARREQMDKDCRAVCAWCDELFGKGGALISPDDSCPYWVHSAHVSEAGNDIPAVTCCADYIRRAFEKDNPS